MTVRKSSPTNRSVALRFRAAVSVVGALVLASLGTAQAVAATSAHAPGPAGALSIAAKPNPRAVLPPATVPPVSNECTEKVIHDEDGNVSPLLCHHGGVNTVAWRHYAYGKTRLLRLGRHATSGRVYAAMCYDYEYVYKTRPMTISAEELAQVYYGWHFTARQSPVLRFELHLCPRP
jgi:hypothetical protein